MSRDDSDRVVSRPQTVRLTALGLAAAMTITGSAFAGGVMEVTGTSPMAYAAAGIDTSVSVTFDRPVDPGTIDSSSFRVFGRWSGVAAGTVTLSNGNQTITLTPDRDFSAGEMVFVNLANTITGADAGPLRPAGYAFAFGTATKPATLNFTEIDSFSNRTEPGAATRIYGAAGSDLNGDGFLDLTTVNEVSQDLRVFLNRADGSGLFDDFLTPFPIGNEASPNEPADFNNDGLVDIAVAASISSSVWVCLGNGDGTWASAQEISVGGAPHGIALLDVDGDADLDIVTANTGGNDLSLMINDGNGVFAPSTSFEGGGDGEYGLSAGDMNNDGIMDLVVGVRFSEQIIIHTGNGDGTLTQASTQSGGGSVWMIALGDVNSDGNLDVSTANSFSSTGSILLNNGGGLNPPSTVFVANQIVATDLGDLDGDGDLDWVLSSFGSGLWQLFVNDGDGNFSFHQQFDAPSNSSCAIMMDLDNDQALDLVLTDEIADVVILQQNEGVPTGAVPAMSTWGTLAMGLLLLATGTVLYRRPKPAPAHA